MITIEDIEAAEALLGIAYTPDERAQMSATSTGRSLRRWSAGA